MICAKIQPKGILGSGEEGFLKFFFSIYMGMATILVNGPWPLLAIFHSPNLRRLHMKFELNWLSGFKGEVV